MMDFDTIGRNEVIGRLRLSCKYWLLFCTSIMYLSCTSVLFYTARSSSGQAETKQWGEMIAKTRQEHTAWHR